MALATLVITLARRGHGGLLLPPQPTLAEQVSDRIAAEPARAWHSHDLQDALGVSAATLRRRLAAEGTNLRTLLTEAIASRRAMLEMASDGGGWVAGAHLPFPGLGHVRRDGRAYAWVPAEFSPL